MKRFLTLASALVIAFSMAACGAKKDPSVTTDTGVTTEATTDPTTEATADPTTEATTDPTTEATTEPTTGAPAATAVTLSVADPAGLTKTEAAGVSTYMSADASVIISYAPTASTAEANDALRTSIAGKDFAKETEAISAIQGVKDASVETISVAGIESIKESYTVEANGMTQNMITVLIPNGTDLVSISATGTDKDKVTKAADDFIAGITAQ